MPEVTVPTAAPTRLSVVAHALLLIAALAGIGAAGYYGYERLRAPVVPAPVAVLSGSFLGSSVPHVGAGAEPGAPAAPVGMFLLDASGSTSHRPIRWKVRGGHATVMPMTPAGKPADSMALVTVFDHAPYRFIAIARGQTGGVADADAATYDASPSPTPPPDVPTPPAPPASPWVTLGKAYRPTLGSSYADAFEGGAKMLDGGMAVSAVTKQIGAVWTAARTANYDRMLTPEFTKIIPESTADASVTPAQRAALAQAWRDFAAGLRTP